MLAALGLLPTRSIPLSLANRSRRATACFTCSAICVVAARLIRKCSHPSHSVVSPNTPAPPSAISRSVTSPTKGFATSPEVGSDMPHSSAIIRSLHGNSSRCWQEICEISCAPCLRAADRKANASRWVSSSVTALIGRSSSASICKRSSAT